ncbi:RES family NAD+ phosphorylase (plasmid) [Klebsiella pneumoniae]
MGCTLDSLSADKDKVSQKSDMAELPDNWADEEAPPELAAYGDAWCFAGESVALRVPSALSPVEFNYLLNAEYPDFFGIAKIAEEIPFRFYTRLKPSRT